MIRALSLSVLLSLAALPVRAEVLVFAAASLKGPLDQIAAEFGDVTVSYGGSGTLARQVSLGAPADVVLLANVAWMDILVAGGDVASDSVADFASNSLVVIGKVGQAPISLDPNSFAAVLRDQRLAIGLTNAVPAGIYAKAALQIAGLWELTQNQLAEVDNVRAALTMVARGQTPLGIVYATDVRVSADVVAVAAFAPDSHPPIRYTGAVKRDAPTQAIAFWEYVNGPDGQAILQAAGFLPPMEPAR